VLAGFEFAYPRARCPPADTMGLRGPARTRTKVLRLRGTFRKDRHGAGAEPEYSPLAELPEAPGFFDDVALFEWNRVGVELVAKRLLTEVDLAPFTAYCLNVARMVKAEREVQKDGLTVLGPMGIKAHPSVLIGRQCGAEVLKFAKEFGLTPASRTRVSVPEAPPAATANPWDQVG
jgi:P27 family predicted phage terminase small subunit